MQEAAFGVGPFLTATVMWEPSAKLHLLISSTCAQRSQHSVMQLVGSAARGLWNPFSNLLYAALCCALAMCRLFAAMLTMRPWDQVCVVLQQGLCSLHVTYIHACLPRSWTACSLPSIQLAR